MGYQCIQVMLYITNVNQIAVLVQFGSLKLYLYCVMVRVPVVLRPPIATNQEMLGDKITFDGQSIHRASVINSVVCKDDLYRLLRVFVE